jgi:hypothetical protein
VSCAINAPLVRVPVSPRADAELRPTASAGPSALEGHHPASPHPYRVGEIIAYYNSYQRYHLAMSTVGRVAYTPLYGEALAYVAGLHAAHLRKGPDDGPKIPYITHLLSVSALVWEATGGRVPKDEEPTNQELAIAAVLHDSVEDQGGRPVLEEIRRRFGEHVAGIVDECSDSDVIPKPPWCERKRAHIEHMTTASKGALIVVAADKLHNVTCMIEDYVTDGDKLWERFDAPSKPSDIFWYYGEIHKVLCQRLGDIRLVNRLGEGVDRLTMLVETQGR